MPNVKSFAAKKPKAPLEAHIIPRREPGAHDVAIDIKFCGVCHSDIHQARDEWGPGIFPMVPGHEIVGLVSKVGSAVKKFKVGDAVGVGCFVDSCRECSACKAGEEQYCERGMIATYNSKERDGTPTYGGYSTHVVVDENYVLRIPKEIPLDRAAPLLCAGITTYSPLRHWKIKAGDKVAVVGLGGLGHMGVKLANAMGAEVTVLSTSDKKKKDAETLGAKHFASTRNADTFQKLAGSFDYILDTVSADHDLNAYLSLLKTGGTMILVGVPDKPASVSAFSVVARRRSLAGSMIGGIRETQEMLDFCAKHKLAADIEVIPAQKINEAYERMLKGDVHYRFVIDTKSIG
ncbi:MAG: NAD(P)-dependent alcohol dehydrogenase [Bdellovibrionales bacterium]|nr:NAD(P)-dependent alcohol dehydrogenase [Bdellovibrionales bacterium]